MGGSEGEVGVANFCKHSEQPGALCPECVTLISVALGTLDRSTVGVIADLADTYAERVLADLPNIESFAEARDGLAGAFLSFLSEAVLTAHNMRL